MNPASELKCTTRAVVACGSCRECCIKGGILVSPLWGDDLSKYQGLLSVAKDLYQLPLKDAGKRCFYLEEAGCSIWEDAPSICKQYNCETYFAQTGIRVRKV